MVNYRILLTSHDHALISTVRGIAMPRQCLVRTQQFAILEPGEPLPDLLVLHVVHEVDVDEGRSLLTIPAGGMRVAFILDSPNPQWELTLLEAGAVDVFVRPLDLNRFSMVINSLALDAEARRISSRPIARAAVPPSPAPASSRRELLSLVELKSHACRHGILFRSQKMLRLMDHLRHVIGRESNILISGETGTGKTQLAQLIHNLSPRSRHPFVVANCAALTPSLLESELFGHAKGAFTGATQAHEGKFHAADAGTIFLDEIDSLPPSGQQRLLRVLDQRVYEKVGSNEPRPLKARVIAAANRPLEKLVADGQFRSDLYYRLKVVTVNLPALRERREDIVPIAMHLVREEAEREGDPVPEITPDVLERLTEYDWPGNIRELRNVISQMVVFAGGGSLSPVSLLEPSLSPEPSRSRFSSDTFRAAPEVSSIETSAANAGRPRDELDAALLASESHSQYVRPLQFERAKSEATRILRELRQHDFNRTKTAESLGISRNALYKKLKKLNLTGFI